MWVTEEVIKDAQQRALGAVINILHMFPDAVPDVLQEACLKAYIYRAQFRGDAKFSTWFYRIAVNEAIMYRRKQRARCTVNAGNCIPLEQHREDPDDGSEYDWLPPADTLNPEEILLRRERTGLLAKHVLALRSSMRSAILRHATTERGTGGADYNASTEKARRHRGFAQLRNQEILR